MTYSKASIPESTYPGAFYMLREEEAWTPGLDKTRRLIAKLGKRNDRVLALRARLPIGQDGMRPNEVTGTNIGWRWPSARVRLSGVAWVDVTGALIPTRHEEVTACAFRVDDHELPLFNDCAPRSFSVLPVAKACPAKCAFCFSKASVSDLERQRNTPRNRLLAWADFAKDRGAERAVITGGGEPTLLRLEALCDLVGDLRERFPKTLLITNGQSLSQERLSSLRDAGLTTLAISRHGLSPAHDEAIMGLRVDSAMLAQGGAALGLRTRAICVIHRDGVADGSGVKQYLERSARDGFQEVCFKELYVSSLSENPWAPSAANQYCEANQVPLSVVIDALTELDFAEVDRLPWGSPVFEGHIGNRMLRVAAYTEPSVGWERTNRLVRSWNLLADGTCLASLEDPSSQLDLPSGA
jgi:hypothetical protein